MYEQEINQEENYVDIHPLKKGRRVLVFIADFLIHFILSFLIFNIAIAPIGKAITNYNKKNDEHISLTAEMYNHYYKSGVLLADSSFEKLDVTAGVEYTYRCFLSFFVLDSEETSDTNYPQYGHKIENNTIYHFYHDIRNNDALYIENFNIYNEKDKYFEFDDVLQAFILKEEVKNELSAFFDPRDAMGETGKKYYSNILENLFNPLMAEVMTDIEKNDIHFHGENYSYLGCKERVEELEKYHEDLMSICAVIAHFLIWAILFVIIPLVNKNRKTLAMMFMKIEKVNFYSLNLAKRSAVIIVAAYYLFAMMLGLMFIPSLLVPFNNLFALRFLMYGTIVSGVLLLASLFFTLFNQYNRSLIDYLSNTLYLSNEEMNEVYRARGYKI